MLVLAQSSLICESARWVTECPVHHGATGRDGHRRKKEQNKYYSWYSVQGGPNASGWYRRLREQISPLSLLNCDQLWQLFSRVWTILLLTVIYELDCRITANIQNVSPLSTQCRPRSVFTLWDALRYLYLRVSVQRFEPGGFIEPRRFRIIFP